MVTENQFEESYDSDEKMVGIGIDFPTWMINRLDAEAEILGVSRQALVNMWIAGRMEKVS